MATGDLTTLANVKQFLGISGTTDDALLTRLVTDASQYIQTWLNRNLGSATYTEYRDGTGGEAMTLREYPITAVSSVTVDTTVVPLATDPLTSGYRFDQERVVLRDYAFNKGFQNVKIVYTAGYAAIPPEIEQAAIDMAANIYRNKDRLGVSSKSLAGESITYITAAMTDQTKAILANYKQVVPN